ncbi:MAG TPA: tRNA (5-methylaminomethyl-2-thiouridine)(34)-methyltransferase MnmD [Chryseolinea sp.]|nr:tRNA (5-methylaminomethyl-2-thiouridine)(34)-methyltransferase MnmD [Chryseolinea sp.]
MPDLKLIVTSDGSHSLFNEALNETYHSVHGAIQESQHVFIKNGLNYFLEKHSPSVVSIFEVGFGTGLNALLAVKAMQNPNVAVKYVSVEAFPIGETLWNGLNYTTTLGFEDAFAFLHRSPWEIINKISGHIELLKLQTTLEKVQLKQGSFDLVFFDAFAPNKQPELWTIDMLRKVVTAMKSNGVFVTYCAKGQLKRDLKELGLYVETLPGPPGKKEMVRAVKLASQEDNL